MVSLSLFSISHSMASMWWSVIGASSGESLNLYVCACACAYACVRAYTVSVGACVVYTESHCFTVRGALQKNTFMTLASIKTALLQCFTVSEHTKHTLKKTTSMIFILKTEISYSEVNIWKLKQQQSMPLNCGFIVL